MINIVTLDFMTCRPSGRFNIQLRDPYLSFRTLKEDKI